MQTLPNDCSHIEDVHYLFCACFVFFFFFSFLKGDELRHLVVRNTLGVPSLCNLLLQKFLFLFIQTLPNDCSHIEDVHLLFCACFIISFLFLRGVELKTFFTSKMLRGFLVCVICNSNSIHSFIFILYMMIFHTLKMCTSHFVHISYFLYF